MDITYISATDLKRKAAEILNSVYYKRNITIVERFGKAIAKIVPMEEEKEKERNISMVLNNYFGALPDFPETRSTRHFRKKDLTL